MATELALAPEGVRRVALINWGRSLINSGQGDHQGDHEGDHGDDHLGRPGTRPRAGGLGDWGLAIGGCGRAPLARVEGHDADVKEQAAGGAVARGRTGIALLRSGGGASATSRVVGFGAGWRRLAEFRSQEWKIGNSKFKIQNGMPLESQTHTVAGVTRWPGWYVSGWRDLARVGGDWRDFAGGNGETGI